MNDPTGLVTEQPNYRVVGDGTSAITSFGNALNDPSFSDVTFVLGPKEYHAHRCILAARSEAFRAMLFGGSKEAKEKKVIVEDIDPDHFYTILEWAYTGRATMSAQDVLGVLKLANFYVFPDLETHCRDLAAGFIDTPNVLSLLDSALENEEQTIVDKCLGFLVQNLTDSIQTSSWLRLNREGVVDILSQKSLDVNEHLLFKRTVEWVESNCKDFSKEKKNEVLQSFLVHIRFSQLSTECLMTEVKPLVTSSGVHHQEYVEALEFKLAPEFFKNTHCIDRLCPRVPSIFQRIAQNVPIAFLNGWTELVRQDASAPLCDDVLRNIKLQSTTYICVGEMERGAKALTLIAVGNIDSAMRRASSQAQFFQDGSIYWCNTACGAPVSFGNYTAAFGFSPTPDSRISFEVNPSERERKLMWRVESHSQQQLRQQQQISGPQAEQRMSPSVRFIYIK